jgi:aryl-alcohol dehydrogenase-like predicted oxidoreductase
MKIASRCATVRIAEEADNTPMQFLDALYESGCRFWDTANVYGDSEELLGKW